MFRMPFLLLVMLCGLVTGLHAEDHYCYQKPDKCSSGDILILTVSEDVAKYCDFNKQITALTRHTTSRSFNNQEVVCVKVVTPRKEKK